MSPEAMNVVKREALGGLDAAGKWNDALNALHAYAQASGCPPGHNVTAWFGAQSQAYQDALSAAFARDRAAVPKENDHE